MPRDNLIVIPHSLHLPDQYGQASDRVRKIKTIIKSQTFYSRVTVTICSVVVVTHTTPRSNLLRTRLQKCARCRSNDQIRGSEKDGLMDLPRVPLVAPSFFVPRSGTLESLFRGVCKNKKTGRRNLS